MAWIIAAAAVGSALLNAQSQSQAGAQSSQQAALQSNRPSAGGNTSFTPTAQTAQEGLTEQSRPRNPSAAAAQQPPRAAEQSLFSQPSAGEQPQQGGQGGGGQALSNVNQAVQLGSTLQQIFRGEQDRGESARSQALAGNRPQTPQPFQPTALDPRLQQILGGR